MDNDLINQIESWVNDFEKTQPKNVQVDDDTFEGSAYNLFQRIISRHKGYFPITSVCREDLKGLGYDTSKIEDGTMERLASKMADAYCDNGFWIDLPIIADYLDIPHKNEKIKKLNK